MLLLVFKLFRSSDITKDINRRRKEVGRADSVTWRIGLVFESFRLDWGLQYKKSQTNVFDLISCFSFYNFSLN